MKVTGSYLLNAPREQVWSLINNPAALVSLIPGCEKLEQVGPAEYRGQMQIRLPAVAGRYEVYVRLLEDDELYRRRFAGEVNGPAGSIRGDAAFALQATADKTTLEYEAQGTVAGLLARLSERFVEGAARGLLNQGLARLDRDLNEIASLRSRP